MLLPVTTLGQMTQIAAPLFNRSRLLVTMEAKGAKIPFSPLPPATLLSATPPPNRGVMIVLAYLWPLALVPLGFYLPAERARIRRLLPAHH